jgi:choline dehydrogenase-like flavoprotein
MVAKFDLNDDNVVVVIGTGAGGGVLSNELAQKGVKVVALEAGGRYLPEDYVNDEWESFGQLAWTDPAYHFRRLAGLTGLLRSASMDR